MSGPYEEDERVPLRLQPVVARPDGWRGRSSSIVAVGLVAFVGFALVLGTAFDEGGAPNSPAIAAVIPTPSPTRPPTATPTRRPDPLPTQLPRIERFGGDIPTEQRLVDGYGLMRFDLSTGELGQLASPLDYTAQLLPSGEIVCACVVRDAAANGGRGSSTLRFGRYEPDGTPIVEQQIRSFEGTVDVPTMGEGFNVVAGLEPGGARLYALVVERRPPVWTITLLAIDTTTGEILSVLDVGDVPSNADTDATPSASPAASAAVNDDTTPDGTYLWPSILTVAPGGGSAYAAIERSDVRQEVWSWQTLEWMIELVPVRTAEARPLPGFALEPGPGCADQPVYVDSNLLVRVCSASSSNAWIVRRIRADGSSPGDLTLPPTLDTQTPLAVVAIPAQRALYLWDQFRHALTRVDVDTGEVTDVTVPESLIPRGPTPAGDPGRFKFGSYPGLVASSTGDRLYAIGVSGAVGDSLGAPSGIWVFDPATLALVDHWDARAFLTSLGLSGDGRFLYASGAAGLDVDGRENPWLASVTVYDVATGEIRVVYGSVAGDGWVRFLPLPEAAP